jgi:hypothetical protein
MTENQEKQQEQGITEQVNANIENNEQPVIEEQPMTPYNKAEKALNEACEKYKLTPYHIAKVISDKIKQQSDLLKNEAHLYKNDMDKMKSKVEYKELIARDVMAQRTIDNHNNEMLSRQQSIAKDIVEYHNALKLTEQQMEGVNMVAEIFKLNHDKIKEDLDKKINDKATATYIMRSKQLSEQNKIEIDKILDKIKTFFGDEQYENFMTSF